MKFLLTILLIMGLIGCSGSKVENEAEGAADEALDLAGEVGLEDGAASGDDFLDEEFSDEEFSDDIFAEETTEGTSETAAADEFLDEEVVLEEPAPQEEILTEDISPVAEASTPAPSMQMTGSNGWYTVERGDTLMIIAFKIYGDYERWRSLANKNAGKLGANYSLRVGMQLQYDEPVEKFDWNPTGNPYLIRSGDTLGTISRDTYGTMGYWRNIWDNNRPLIKDPNRIFAGFTIYTPNLESRDVANVSNGI